MTHALAGRRIAILATDGVERVELEQPRGALYGAGASSDLLSVHAGEIQARQFDIVSAGTFTVSRPATDAAVDEYDALLLPGGTANPETLRINPDAVGFVKAFVATGKRGHLRRAWTLIEADVVRGHRFTSWPSRACGPTYATRAPRRWTRRSWWTGSSPPAAHPPDLPAFCPSIVERPPPHHCTPERSPAQNPAINNNDRQVPAARCRPS